jgi:putative ABC transport system permease protein
MFKNYLKITLRNLLKNKTYSFINIFGLSIAITCTILILLWVNNELSYDMFNKNAKQIYRVVQYDNNGKNSRSPAQLAPALAAEIPEIDSYARIVKLPRIIFKKGTKNFNEDNGIIVDPRFFTMFDFPLLKGNPKTFLSESGDIVITESLAKKYFGDEDPVNKTIQLDGQNEVKVTGILKDIPGQSHIQFDFVMPFSLWEILSPSDVKNWGAFNYTTYLHLKENADVGAATIKINKLAGTRMPQQLLSDWKKFELQPLAQCHLSADIENTQFLGNFTVVEDGNTVYMFSVIAFFILLLACINFMNLSTARSGMRTREIGLKKVIGSSRAQLIFQFLGEFFLLSIIAFVFAIVSVQLLLPYFNQISGKELVINHAKNIVTYILIILLTTLLGGFYPAFYLSSFNPIKILKGQIHGSSKAKKMRSVLVVFQFAISIILVTGTIVVFQQLQYIQNKKLGFQKENIIYTPIAGNVGNKYNALKNELLKNPDVSIVTAKDCLPTTLRRNLVDFYWDEKVPGQNVLMELTGVDYKYFEALNIKFEEGRSFSEEFPTDANAFILNEEAVKQTGLKSPVGKKFATYNKSGVIIGVIKNTNFKSLHNTVNPQVYHLMNNVGVEAAYTGVMLIKLNGIKQAESLSSIEDTWKSFNPNVPFEYHFLDQTYEKLYSVEQRTRTIFNYFSFLAILIACLGLYGLAAFTAERRSKEIGIRKALGADVKSIVSMFTNDFTKLVLLANIIAWPVAYYFMNKWLQDFAYRIEISWWMFVLSGGIALLIALATVSFQAIKAATVNPVESLRYE